MSRMLQNYQFLVGNDPNRRYPRDVNNLDELVTSIVNEVVGGASVDLDSLGELSSALQNNPDFLTTLQGRDAELLSAVGIAAGNTDMGAFADPGIPDAADLKVVLEAIGAAATRLREGLGVASGDNDMGTFTGSTIGDNVSVKAALQALETYCEANNSAAVQTYVDQQIATDMWMFADQAAFPAAASNHGRVVHSHADGAMYFAHAGAWHKLQTDSSVDADESSLQGAIDATVARLDALEADTTSATAVAAVQADVDQNEVDADAADLALSGRLDVLEVDPTTQAAVDAVNQSLTVSLGGLNADVVANKTASDNAEAALSGRVDALEVDPTTATAVTSGDAATLASANAYTDAEVASLIDSAPGAINTLNELAAAIGDDANFAATITNSVAAETTARTNADAALDVRVDALELDPTTATAVAAVQSDVDQNEADSDAADAALSARITTLEADVDQNETDADAAIAANEVHIDNLATLSGVAKDATTLGSFGGSTISNNTDVKQALGELEAGVEGRATTAYVDNEIAALVDGAPLALDTLNEIAAAIADDANVAGSLTALINANETHIDNAVTLTGVAKDATNLGSFTGTTITNDGTIKAAVQELETAFEAFDVTAGVNAVQADVDQNEADSDAADAAIVDGTTNFTGFQLDGTAVTATGAELNFVDGVTSNIQTQLDAIQADVDQNESDADSAIAAVQADVDQNEADADTAIALKANKAGDTFTGVVTVQDHLIVDDANNAATDYNFNVKSSGSSVFGILGNGAVLLGNSSGSPFMASADHHATSKKYVDDAVSNVVDAAPGALDTLNELAAALGDDENFATTITNSIAAVQSDVDQNESDADAAIAAVQADVDQNETDSDAAEAALSGRIDTLEADPTTATAVAAVQADVDQNEADADAAIAANEVHIDNLATLSGVAKDSANFGTFTGSTISDSRTGKQAFQDLETALELRSTIASPTFTGTPAAPTANAGTNTTQIASTAFVTGAVSDLVGTAPSGLNTLGELATALQSDTNAIGNMTTLINANTSDVADLRTTQGTADGATHLGTFSGSTISDNGTVKASLQELETALEANVAGTTSAGVVLTVHGSFDASAAGSFVWADDKIASHGVTSVARTAQGKYTVTFANAFDSGNYTVICDAGSQDRTGVSASPRVCTCTARTTTTMDLVVELSDSAGNVDEAYISFIVVGTLA